MLLRSVAVMFWILLILAFFIHGDAGKAIAAVGAAAFGGLVVAALS
jgi:hypothetical protein